MSGTDFLNTRFELWAHWGELHDHGPDALHLKGVFKGISEYARRVNEYLDLDTPDKPVVLFEVRTILEVLDNAKDDPGFDFSRERPELERALGRLAPIHPVN